MVARGERRYAAAAFVGLLFSLVGGVSMRWNGWIGLALGLGGLLAVLVAIILTDRRRKRLEDYGE